MKSSFPVVQLPAKILTMESRLPTPVIQARQ